MNNAGGAGGSNYYLEILPGELSRSVLLTPRLDNFIEGDEAITITLIDTLDVNHQYSMGSPSQVELIILDFRDVVFTDSFEE
jgi:hypothetical protein